MIKYEPLLFTKHVEISTTPSIAFNGVRLCVTGGRTYDDEKVVADTLAQIAKEQNIREIGVGCARGLDALVLEWAEEHHYSYRCYHADWDRYGLTAGLYRNEAMLLDFKPDILLVFPGGTGTTDCARRARKLDIPRTFIDADTDPMTNATRWG